MHTRKCCRTQAHRLSFGLRLHVDDRDRRVGAERFEQPRQKLNSCVRITVQARREPHAQRFRNASAGRHQHGVGKAVATRPVLRRKSAARVQHGCEVVAPA